MEEWKIINGEKNKPEKKKSPKLKKSKWDCISGRECSRESSAEWTLKSKRAKVRPLNWAKWRSFVTFRRAVSAECSVKQEWRWSIRICVENYFKGGWLSRKQEWNKWLRRTGDPSFSVWFHTLIGKWEKYQWGKVKGEGREERPAEGRKWD